MAKNFINFSTTKEDAITISKIADRVCNHRPLIDRMTLEMDITATHLNGTPLDLETLEAAPSIHFWHDINGIIRNINRETGKLDNCFSPRYALEQKLC